MSVLLPDPLEPTSAVVEPAGRVKRHVLQHRHAGLVLEGDVVEHDLAADARPAAPARRRPASSVAMRRISRMRSSPANASVICVPIDAIWMTGTAIMPVNRRYMTKSPSVIVPGAGSAWPPTSIMITPMSADHQRRRTPPTAETPVIVAGDVAEQRCAPCAKTSSSRLSAVYALTMRTPPSDSASRPVTSALILAALAEQRPQPLERRTPSRRRTTPSTTMVTHRQLPVEVEQDAERDDAR